MTRRILALFGVCALAAGVACSTANPAAPVPPAAGGATAAADGSTLKVTAPGVQSPINNTKLQSPIVVLNATAAQLQFQSATPVVLQYRFQVFSGATMVVNSLSSTTSFQVPTTLVENTTHTWKVRAESNGEAGPFSSTASFITEDPALINDPLTDGTTKGARIGGRFIAGQGWQSNSLTDGIDYDIAQGCISCKLDFDATNFGPTEGAAFEKDIKWLSMGDPRAFGSFADFRDHPWKMHLVQRADFPTGMEIIWRNGGTDPEGDPGDHRIKLTSTPIVFNSNNVYHFTVEWDIFGYHISVNGIEVMSDGWNHWYELKPLRVELGCIPRAESFIGIIYRNVKLVQKR